jgi:glycosyltransferase involved in cell wall biosynthesis
VVRCGTVSPAAFLISMTPLIAHVNTARGYRGGERQTELLIQGLAGRGVRQALIARRGSALMQRVRALGVDVREVGGGPLSVAVASGGAALLHVHEGRSVYGAYVRSLMSGTPYVITRRVDNPIGQHWLAHRAYAKAAGVAAVAPQIAAIVHAYDPAIAVRVIHSASTGFVVDAGNVAAIRAGLAGKFVVGHVGALDNAQKNQELIIAVAREIERSHPGLHFVLVGGGEDEAALKIAAAGLTNVTFTGFVQNVGDWLAAFDLFILPSNREGIGGILFDAMEQGLAVVVSAVGGLPDIVKHGDNGLLIEPRRPDQLRDAILGLAAQPERRKAMGARGREFAKGFGADAMCAKYVDLYQSVLGPVT